MKNFVYVLLSSILLISCSERDNLLGDTPNMTTSKSVDEFEKLNKQILQLDEQYVSLSPIGARPMLHRVPNGPNGWDVACADATGILASRLWVAFAPTVTSKLLVAASIGALFSAEYYINFIEGYQVLDLNNINLTSLEDFRNVDVRQPIQSTVPTNLYNDNIIGKNVGPLHNRGVLGLYRAGRLMPNVVLSPNEVFDSICSGVTDFEEISYESLSTPIEHGYSEFNTTSIIHSLNNHFSEELEIIDHVYEVSLNLDSVTLFDYTNQVMEIVHDAYVHELISDSSAWLINASVSTLAHTRLLWKSYLPDYRLTTMYFAYIADFDKWVLCNHSQLQELSNTYHVTRTGIPSIIRGKCTEIFFFPSSSTYYNVSNINYSQPIQNSYFQLSNNVSFERMIPVYSNRLFEHMESGYYHVRNVPNENGITYVSFLEP